MARVDRNPEEGVAMSMDQWAGYDVARKRLISWMRDHRVSNPVVLTGDIHTNWVNDLKVDFDDVSEPVTATEFVGTSISSGGDGTETRKDTEGVLRDNPFVKFYNAERGYVRCTITPSQWTSDYRVLPKVTEPTFEALRERSLSWSPANRRGASIGHSQPLVREMWCGAWVLRQLASSPLKNVSGTARAVRLDIFC